MSPSRSQLALLCGLSQLATSAFSLGLQSGAYAPDSGNVAVAVEGSPSLSSASLSDFDAPILNQVSADPAWREAMGSVLPVGRTFVPEVVSAPVDTPSLVLAQKQQQIQQEPLQQLQQGPLGLGPQLHQIQQMQEDLTTVSSQGASVDVQTNIEQEIERTQQVASRLAQDAAALSGELAKLEGALRGQPISQHAGIAANRGVGSAHTISSGIPAETMSLETCQDACTLRNMQGMRGCCEFAKGICHWHADSFVDSSRFVAGRFATDCHMDNEGCLPIGENVCEGRGVAITAQGITATEGLADAKDSREASDTIASEVMTSQLLGNGTKNGTSNSTKNGTSNSTDPSWFDQTSFPSPFFTLGHRLSNFWTVVFWVAVGLVIIIFSFCCFRFIRRPRADAARLL